MDESDIKAARALCDAATPAPWGCTSDEPIGIFSGRLDSLLTIDVDGMACVLNPADARLMTASRTLLPAALEALEAARRERDEARTQVLAVVTHAIEAAERDVSADLAATKAALAEAKRETALAKSALASLVLVTEAVASDSWREDPAFVDQLAALKAKVRP